MPAKDLQPRKPPRQARSAAMVELVLQAATRVLGTESLAGFTTNRVAEVAGVSIGSLYQYFPNKSSLVAALIEREQSALARAVTETVSSTGAATLPEALSIMVDIGIQHQFGNPLYAAALDHEEKRLPLESTLRTAQVRIMQALQELLQKHFHPANATALPLAAKDCLTITKALIEAESPDQADSNTSLRGRVLCALLGYLCHSNASLIPIGQRHGD